MSKAEILIIDDEPQIRKMLEITLQTNGYLSKSAVSAKEGLIMAANHPPELILLDLGLPDENGHMVLQKLRQWYTNPVIILSVQKNEGKVLTHQYLLRAIWGPGFINQSQYLRVFIAQIRKKIETDANRPEYLLTESGVGYRFMFKN